MVTCQHPPTRHPALRALFGQRGAVSRVASSCGISVAAVSKWRTVPPERVEQVASALGVDATSLPVARRIVQLGV